MKRLMCLCVAVSLLFGFASLAAAQGQPAQFIQVVTVTVKSESVADYEDYVKKIQAAANKIGAPQRVFASQVILGGPGFTYSFVLPFNKWGEVDTWPTIPEMLSKAYGDAEAAKILKAGRAAIDRSRSEVFRLLGDLSTRPKVFDPPPAFTFLVRTEVKPEMASAYELYLAKLKAAQEQLPNAPTANRRVSLQGQASTYVTATPFNKHSERDAWPSPGEALRKAYGEAEASHILETSLRCVSNREFLVLAYRPDLSRPIAAPGGN